MPQTEEMEGCYIPQHREVRKQIQVAGDVRKHQQGMADIERWDLGTFLPTRLFLLVTACHA